jgi:hypothetical protein
MNKLENIMLRYFELINSLPYDEVKMATSLMEPMGIVVLTIYVKTMDEKYLYQKMINRKRVIDILNGEMSYMFPYVFLMKCKVKI